VKNAIKALLQKLLGYRRYLRVFAAFKVRTLYSDKRERDFFSFLELLPAEGIVLDVGANLGFISAHLARKVSNGIVYAYEPMPDNLDALNHVIRKFKLRNVKVEAFALGNEDGEVEMVLPVEGSARQQGLSHIVHEELKDHNVGIRFKVPLKRLDSLDYLFTAGAKVSGIKMDVENFEHFVLSGANKLVATHQPLIYLELWENENRTKCFELLKTWSYRVTVNENGKHVTYDAKSHPGRINFLAVPATYSF
jgi:FkbM family methyltransferase